MVLAVVPTREANAATITANNCNDGGSGSRAMQSHAPPVAIPSTFAR